MQATISSLGACFETARRPASWLSRACRSCGVNSAVRKRNGMSRVSLSEKKSAERSPPSIPGRSMSHSTRSGRLERTARSASSALAQPTRSKALPSLTLRYSNTASSSSTSSSFFFCSMSERFQVAAQLRAARGERREIALRGLGVDEARLAGRPAEAVQGEAAGELVRGAAGEGTVAGGERARELLDHG